MKYTMTVEWAHCDAAGIVFYPNYFRWFDTAFQRLLRQQGFDQRILSDRFGIIGTALAGCDAKLLRPLTFGDEISLESKITDWRDARFSVEHRVEKHRQLSAIGHEHRFWALRDEATGKLGAGPIPAEFRNAFSAD